MDSDSEPANLPGQAPRDSKKTCEVSERDLLSGVLRHRQAGRKLPLRDRMMAWAAIAAVCLLAPALGLLPPLTGQPHAPAAAAQETPAEEAATGEAAADGEAAGSDAAAEEKPGDHAAPHGEQAAAGAHRDGAAHAEGEHAGEEHEESHGVGHSDPVAPVLLAIVLILLLAKVGGDLFERVGMPAVLGELVVGIILGNFALLTGSDIMDPFFHIPTISEIPEIHSTANFYNTAVILKILAGIGVVLLLFEVGLESTVRQMMSVGITSLNVALLGVVAPMGLGWLCAWLIIPDHGWQVHSFIGATLCATSVGITARVLKDLGRSQQRESQIILGAAVIDDVLGLVVLAVVAGVIQQGTVEVAGLLKVIGLALGFLAGSVLLGTMLVARPLFLAASYLRGHGMLVATSLVICFGFAWLANLVGLAPIVGAFAAGLILEKAHYRELNAREHHD
ncbi:MAG: cation:proton antiporter, partial [Planctomycetaceae bacterium]|nr:cation:proton antiporter [Planctomycetaceae bacterium]